MRKAILFALITLGLISFAFAQEEDPTEQLLSLALTQDEVREALGDGNESWVLESSGVVPRPPAQSVGVSATFVQGAQVIRVVIYEFETADRGLEFVELGIDSVLASLSGEPKDTIENFIDEETEEPKVPLAVLLSFRDEGDTQLIYLRPNPEAETALVVLLRSNLNESQILNLGNLQLSKLIEAGK